MFAGLQRATWQLVVRLLVTTVPLAHDQNLLAIVDHHAADADVVRRVIRDERVLDQAAHQHQLVLVGVMKDEAVGRRHWNERRQ